MGVVLNCESIVVVTLCVDGHESFDLQCDATFPRKVYSKQRFPSQLSYRYELTTIHSAILILQILAVRRKSAVGRRVNRAATFQHRKAIAEMAHTNLRNY